LVLYALICCRLTHSPHPSAPTLPAFATLEGLDEVVARAAELARPGDTVLLAPAAASMDMFRDYNARGDAFAAAVRRFTNGAG